MNLLKSKAEFVNKISLYLGFSIILYQTFYHIYPFRFVIETAKLEWISPLMAVLAFTLLGIDLLVNRVCFKGKYVWLLIGTLGVLSISTVINISIGFIANVKSVIWQSVQMLYLYPLCYRIEKNKFDSTLRNLYLIISGVFSSACIFSLYHFLTFAKYNIRGVRQGVQDGHLFGVFSSVYFAGVICVILLFTSIYMFVKNKSNFIKVWSAVTAVLMILYIVLCNSRSVMLSLIAGTMICVFLSFRNYLSKKEKVKNSFLKNGLCVILSGVMAMGVVAVNAGMHNVLKTIPIVINQQNIDITENDKDNNNTTTTTKKPSVIIEENKDTTDLERTDISSENISNNRFTIWKDYLKATTHSTKSLLFGLTPGGYMENLRENQPDLYIVRHYKLAYTDLYNEGYIYDVHNGYITIFVMSGILGVLVFGSFLVICVFRTLKKIFNVPNVSGRIILYVSIITTMLVAAFFDCDLFFRVTGTSTVFWFVAGLLMHSLEKEGQI